MSLALELLECPSCHACRLKRAERDNSEVLACSGSGCGGCFPLRSGIGCFIHQSDDYLANYNKICDDDLVSPKTPSVVKEIFTGLVCERITGGATADLGCGDGHVIRSVKATPKIAVDIAFRYLERLPESITRLWSFAENLPLKSHSLNTIICTDLLEHVLDASRLAGELSRLVKENGKLLLACPFEQDLGVYDLPEYKARYGRYKYVHLRSIGDDLIEELFGDFEIRYSHLITEGTALMEFKPYPIKFFELVRKPV